MKKDHSPVSKGIILGPLTLIIVFTVIGFWLIGIYFNNISNKRYEENLMNLARSGAQTIRLLDDQEKSKELDYFANVFTGDSKFRATIINEDGIVLGDSRLSPEEVKEMENQANRPEILSAKESGLGVSRRFSKTLNKNLLLVAVRFNRPGLNKGYFRVALPLTDLEQELRDQRFILGSFCFIALLIACFLSLLTSRYLLSLVRKGEHYLEKRVRKRTRMIEILQNLATQLTACNTKDEALEVIKLVTSMLFPMFTGTIALFLASKDKLEIVKSWNGEWHDDETYSPDQCWALRTGQSHMGDPDSGNMVCAHSEHHRGIMFCVPLVAQGETHGVLHFFSAERIEWTAEEHRLASAVGKHASLTLANLELRESLRQQAIRDPLTGLYNRRYMDETMHQEISRAMRHKEKMGLLMLDLDYFKKFNDEYGHEIGDFILSEFGRLVKATIREEDIPCRYGGEEFTILLPESDRDQTERIAERIRMSVRVHAFLLGHHSYGPITVSIGAALFPENGKTAENLMKQADDALYKSKQTGRDRVTMAAIISPEA